MKDLGLRIWTSGFRAEGCALGLTGLAWTPKVGNPWAPSCLHSGLLGYVTTWTPKVCRIMAFWAIFKRFGPLFYLLLGFRYRVYTTEPRTRER